MLEHPGRVVGRQPGPLLDSMPVDSSGGLHGGRTAQQSVLPWSTLKEADYKAEQRTDDYLQ